MIIDKHLKDFQFSEYHQTTVTGTPAQVYPLVRNIDFGKSKIIKLLFFLRGLPRKSFTINGMIDTGFLMLEEKKTQEIVLGFIFHDRRLHAAPPGEFQFFEKDGTVKGAWNFLLTPVGENQTRVSTETRVCCIGKRAKRYFSVYWFFVGPFSALIRRIMLRLIKKKTGNF